jgi:hypothetical protein
LGQVANGRLRAEQVERRRGGWIANQRAHRAANRSQLLNGGHAKLARSSGDKDSLHNLYFQE